MPTIDVNGRTLHYMESGNGPAILLIHGFPLDGRVWSPVAERLVSRMRVLTPELRGFGRNNPETAFTMDDLADDMAAFMEMLGIAPCPVAGLSMGGYVAQALARKYPGIATKLIMVDTKAEADSAEARGKRDAMAQLANTGGAKAVADQMAPNMLSPATPPAVKANLCAIMESQPAKTLAAASIAMRDRQDFTPLVAGSDSPIHWIFGRDDKISPASAIESLVRPGKDSVTMIDNAGHMSPIEQPAAVAEAIGRAV